MRTPNKLTIAGIVTLLATGVFAYERHINQQAQDHLDRVRADAQKELDRREAEIQRLKALLEKRTGELQDERNNNQRLAPKSPHEPSDFPIMKPRPHVDPSKNERRE